MVHEFNVAVVVNRWLQKCAAESPPAFSSVFALYGAMTPTQTYDVFCTQHETALQNIDERCVAGWGRGREWPGVYDIYASCRRLVQFGLMHGLIRRLRKYPIRTGVTLGPAITEDARLAR